MVPVVLFALLCLARTASAQWATETYPLKAGWNAIWLPLDCTDRAIDTLFAASTDVEEVWRWNQQASSVSFIDSVTRPVAPDVQWHVWAKPGAINPATGNAVLGSLTGNAAYLIKVRSTASAFTLSLTGRPLPPALHLESGGSNLVGFSTLASAPKFDAFFKYSKALVAGSAIFQYVGGPLSDVTPKNPVPVTQLGDTPVTRHQAFWVKSTSATDYYGPLAVTVSNRQGVDFGKDLVTIGLRLKNVTDPAQGQSITATLTPQPSAPVPTANAPGAPVNPAFEGPVPLQVRGAIDPSTLQFTYSSLSSAWTSPSLQPGESIDVVIAVDRAAMTAAAGKFYQRLLEITDSLGHTRLTLPVSAEVRAASGVWVGAAVLNSVNRVEIITGPETDSPGEYLPTTTTNITETTTAAVGTTPASTTIDSVFGAIFDASGNVDLGSSGVTVVKVAGLSGTPVYALNTDYTVGASSRATVTSGGSGYTKAPKVVLEGGGGTLATATATLSGSGVGAVAVTNAGTGYFTPPVVTVAAPPSGVRAVVTAAVSGGSITGFTVTTAGSGYVTAPVVTVADPLVPATATATLSAAVKSVTVAETGGGSGYPASSTFAVTFTGGGGSGASGLALVNDGGKVIDVAVVTGGSGYSSAPTVNFSAGTGSWASATTKISGSVASVSIAGTGGSGYTSAPTIRFIPDGGVEEGSVIAASATAALGAGGNVIGVDSIQKVTGGAIGTNNKVQVTTRTTRPAAAGTAAGVSKTTISSFSTPVAANGRIRLSTRRITSGSGGGAAPSNFPVRLLLHVDAARKPTLLQQVYLGQRNGVNYAGPTEAGIAALVNAATPTGKIVRVSSASFPKGGSSGGPWTAGAGGIFGGSGSASFSVVVPFDAQTNPFVHTYHPDHDNWDARYEKKLPDGQESYTVTRDIKLTFQPTPPAGVSPLGWGVTTVGGTYEEVITGLRAPGQEIGVSGSFLLQQVSTVPTLTNP